MWGYKPEAPARERLSFAGASGLWSVGRYLEGDPSVLRSCCFWRVRVILVALVLPLAGCGKSDPGTPEDNLQKFELDQIFWLYKHHLEDKKRPPAKLADLKAYEQLYDNAFQALQSGKCVA